MPRGRGAFAIQQRTSLAGSVRGAERGAKDGDPWCDRVGALDNLVKADFVAPITVRGGTYGAWRDPTLKTSAIGRSASPFAKSTVFAQHYFSCRGRPVSAKALIGDSRRAEDVSKRETFAFARATQKK